MPLTLPPRSDAIKTLNPHWDQLRALLADHPEYPHWSLAEAEAELEQARERDGPLGTQAMQGQSSGRYVRILD